MKHTVMLVVLVVMLTSVTSSRAKKLLNVKVEVVAQEGIQESTKAGGVVGEVAGRQVATDAFTMRVIVNGEHALLTCYENHNQCHFYGIGTYDGELKTHPNRKDVQDYAGYSSDPDLWIHFIRPLDHRDIREHWRVTGSW